MGTEVLYRLAGAQMPAALAVFLNQALRGEITDRVVRVRVSNAGAGADGKGLL